MMDSIVLEIGKGKEEIGRREVARKDIKIKIRKGIDIKSVSKNI